MGIKAEFSRIADNTAHATGHPVAFVLAILSVVVWAALGPFYNYSETWQIVINTGTTIITFLMIFLLQSSQNRDGAALQAKLDELIRVGQAHNAFMGIEGLSAEEIAELRLQRHAESSAAIPQAKTGSDSTKTPPDLTAAPA